MSKQFKHSLEEKMEAIRLYRKIGNLSEVARVLGVCPSLVYTWIMQYHIGGPSSLIPKTTMQSYSPEVRIAIVEDLRNKSVSLREASAMFGISTKTLSRWKRSVEEKGFTALFDSIPRNHIPGMPRKKKTEEPLTELERLREENMRLRAELDLDKRERGTRLSGHRRHGIPRLRLVSVHQKDRYVGEYHSSRYYGHSIRPVAEE